MNKKKVLLVAALILTAAAAVGAFTPARASSRAGLWKEGIVSEAPWRDTYYYIGIDRISYYLAPDARVSRLEQSGPDQFLEQPYALKNVRYGDRLKFKAQGLRIHSILVLE
ncbi:MAG: hypothetical protein V1816_17435 [Pseudomonadota bacterium]